MGEITPIIEGKKPKKKWDFSDKLAPIIEGKIRKSALHYSVLYYINIIYIM